MASFKKVFKSERFRMLACAVVVAYIWLAHATGRWTVVGRDAPEEYFRRGAPFIICTWHGRMLLGPFSVLLGPSYWDRRRRIVTMLSHHNDGRLAAKILTHFGIDSIGGSSSRGGTAAFRELIKTLRAGDCVGITPDGPRGPRMRAQEGAAVLARLAGVPLIPAAFGARRRRVLGSWDRFIVPWPFTRGVLVYGPPLDFGPADLGATADGGRQALEDALNAVTAEADRLCGHVPIEPAPIGGQQR